MVAEQHAGARSRRQLYRLKHRHGSRIGTEGADGDPDDLPRAVPLPRPRPQPVQEPRGRPPTEQQRSSLSISMGPHARRRRFGPFRAGATRPTDFPVMRSGLLCATQNGAPRSPLRATPITGADIVRRGAGVLKLRLSRRLLTRRPRERHPNPPYNPHPAGATAARNPWGLAYRHRQRSTSGRIGAAARLGLARGQRPRARCCAGWPISPGLPLPLEDRLTGEGSPPCATSPWAVWDKQ